MEVTSSLLPVEDRIPGSYWHLRNGRYSLMLNENRSYISTLASTEATLARSSSAGLLLLVPCGLHWFHAGIYLVTARCWGSLDTFLGLPWQEPSWKDCMPHTYRNRWKFKLRCVLHSHPRGGALVQSSGHEHASSLLGLSSSALAAVLECSIPAE